MKTIKLEPIYSEVVSPRRFLDIYQEEQDNIESVRVLPARVGSRDFGSILVRRKSPVYASAINRYLKKKKTGKSKSGRK